MVVTVMGALACWSGSEEPARHTGASLRTPLRRVRASARHTRSSLAPERLDGLRDLRHFERLALDFGEPLGGHEIRRPQQLHQLAVVQLWHEDPFEPREQLAEVPRDRVQVEQVDVLDVVAYVARFAHRPMDRHERRNPSHRHEDTVYIADG